MLYVTQGFNNLPNLNFNDIKTVNIDEIIYFPNNKDNIIQNYPKNINNVCILGFNFGELPLVLSKNNNIIKIDCVNIEIKMFEIFKTINPYPPKKIHYYLNDVNEYIERSDQKYNMIVDDTLLAKKELVNYTSLKKMLFPGGILFIYIVNFEDSSKLGEDLKKTYENVVVQKNDLDYLITCYRGSN